jgi:hypothetical protein
VREHAGEVLHEGVEREQVDVLGAPQSRYSPKNPRPYTGGSVAFCGSASSAVCCQYMGVVRPSAVELHVQRLAEPEREPAVAGDERRRRGGEVLVEYDCTSVLDGLSKLCHAGTGFEYHRKIRLEELRSMTTSPLVFRVCHSTPSSVRTKLLSKVSVAERDQSPRRAGVARQSEEEDWQKSMDTGKAMLPS